MINIWVLYNGKKIEFRQGKLTEGDIKNEDPIRFLLQAALDEIAADVTVICEDCTVGVLTIDCPPSRQLCEQDRKSFQSSGSPLKLFNEAIIGPLVDTLG